MAPSQGNYQGNTVTIVNCMVASELGTRFQRQRKSGTSEISRKVCVMGS